MSLERKISSKDIQEFANEYVYWWGGKGDDVRPNLRLETMLVFILAKKEPATEVLVREKLGVTDEDFKRALYTAKPGVFMWEESWEEVNKRFGIDPPLPFPKIDWEARNERLKEQIELADL